MDSRLFTVENHKSLDSRALGELGVIKLLSSHFLRTLLIYKRGNLLICHTVIPTVVSCI